jgi:hypothetical protein
MKLQMTSIFAFALLAVACSKKDSGGAATTGSFLKPSDFSNLTYDQITPEKALEQLKESNEIYDDEATSASTPSGDTGGSGSIPAMETCMKNNQPKVNVIEKSTINIDANIDILQCLKEQSGGTGGSTEGAKFAVRYVFNISCPGADFSDLQGKKLDEVGLSGDDLFSSTIEAKCKDSDSFRTFANYAFELTSTATGDEASEIIVKGAQFAKDGTACTHSKVAGGYQTDGCLSINYSRANLGGQGEKELSILESSKLLNTVASNAKWFAGGAFKLSLNNVTGTLTYTGASTAPSYSLTNGGTPLTGTLDDSTLALESFKQPVPARDFLSKQFSQINAQAVKVWNSAR